jgi:hypothetical protein
MRGAWCSKHCANGLAGVARSFRSRRGEMAERYIAQTYDNEAFGALIGATRALRATGAMSERLESYYDRRFERINHAEVRRTRANALREAA